MSDPKEVFKESMAKVTELENLKSDTAAKKAVIDNKRASSMLDKLQQDEKELALVKSANFGTLTPQEIADIQKANDEYIEAAQKPMEFINAKTFAKVVPFFRKNFILIGGKTGEGKSTTVANIAFSVLRQKNKTTGQLCRVLVITNEERAEDFYNRVTALIKGWHYTNHSDFTKEQVDTFHEYIPKLAKNLVVIDNNKNGSSGATTSIEGIEAIFENLLESKTYYDVVIIDYYQNITHSKVNPYSSENEVQAKLARMMDKYKNLYPAPIVMMAQVNPPDKDDKVPFQYRIKGRKLIMDPATLVMEMTADRKNLRTLWTIHKSRFTEAVGQTVTTGYKYGKFVEYTNDFAVEVQNMAYKKIDEAANKAAAQDLQAALGSTDEAK